MADPGPDLEQIVVVGASLAGLRAIEALRRADYGGSIVAIGREVHAPYDRPPLSKKILAGDWEPDRAMLKPADKLDELEVDWRFGVEATGLDLEAKVVATSAGPVPYDGLVIATGARVRHLPDTEGVPGVHALRTLDDCVALRADLDTTTGPVVVIGAGFIGGEVAATVRETGRDVTIIEAAPVPRSAIVECMKGRPGHAQRLGDPLTDEVGDGLASQRSAIPPASALGTGSSLPHRWSCSAAVRW